MDEHPLSRSLEEPDDTPADVAGPRIIEETSTEYLGRWNRLVSTTNWEKGRIICQWREALIQSEAPTSSYTDEAWSRWVGNVSPQHTGRLRRVFRRFGETCEQYNGLYWSHFQTALEWDDAEMWLEGAVQNGWSISQMRHQRWQATGAPEELKPRAEDVITAELDEDVQPLDGESPGGTISETIGEVRDAEGSAVDQPPLPPRAAEEAATPAVDQPAVQPFRPFENLPPLPPDLNEALEAFKLAVLHHRLSGWKDVSCEDVLLALDSLKALALAPADA